MRTYYWRILQILSDERGTFDALTDPYMEHIYQIYDQIVEEFEKLSAMIRQGICRIHPVMGWSRWLIISMIIMIISDYC